MTYVRLRNDKEIEELENRDTCFAVCEKLAWLYIVKDNLEKKMTVSNNKISVSDAMNSSVKSNKGETEFMTYASKVSNARLNAVIDRHLSDLKVIMPNWYNKIIGDIKKLA